MDATRTAKTKNKRVTPIRRSSTPNLLLCIALLILPSAGTALLYHVDANIANLLMIYAAIINLWTFHKYSQDKYVASTYTWRVSEASLHLLGLLGGWPAALAAQRVLRHKTHKASFRSVFWLTVTVHQAIWVSALRLGNVI